MGQNKSGGCGSALCVLRTTLHTFLMSQRASSQFAIKVHWMQRADPVHLLGVYEVIIWWFTAHYCGVVALVPLDYVTPRVIYWTVFNTRVHLFPMLIWNVSFALIHFDKHLVNPNHLLITSDSLSSGTSSLGFKGEWIPHVRINLGHVLSWSLSDDLS